jgi:hypothetical protein
VEARLLRAEGRHSEAVSCAERSVAMLSEGEVAVTSTELKISLIEAIEAALAIPDLDKAEDLLSIPEALSPGELTPLLHAHAIRLRARLDAAHGNHEKVEQGFRSAMGVFREFDMTFHLAVCQVEYAEWLVDQDRSQDAEPPLAEAMGTFERLEATLWVERAAKLASVLGPQLTVG